jgi:hypothetical protein
MRLGLARLIYHFDIELADDSRDWFERRRNFFTWERLHLNVHLTAITNGVDL